METNIDKRKRLIKRLLIEELLPEERQCLLKRESVEKRCKNNGNSLQMNRLNPE